MEDVKLSIKKAYVVSSSLCVVSIAVVHCAVLIANFVLKMFNYFNWQALGCTDLIIGALFFHHQSVWCNYPFFPLQNQYIKKIRILCAVEQH